MKALVVHVPAGSGHEKAAEATALAVRRMDPKADVTVMNGLDGMSSLYQWTFTQGYMNMIHRWPWAWGWAYHLADLRGLAWAAYKLHRLTNASHGKTLERIFLRYAPDVIVCTHFFPAEVGAFLKTRGQIKARLITVITDFLPHSVWIAPGTDAYAVASTVTREELIHRGVPAEKIRVTGIPIDAKFSRPIARAAVAQRLGLDPSLFTVLVASGGFGTGPVAQQVTSFAGIPGPLQILVVTGKNTALFRRLEEARAWFPHALKLYGFVDNMEELMAASDLLVTKPGGLSCCEALSRGLPMILAAAIPGQESRNAQVIERTGAAVLAKRADQIPALAQQLRDNPQQLQAMSRAARETGAPNAAEAVARLALETPMSLRGTK